MAQPPKEELAARVPSNFGPKDFIDTQQLQEIEEDYKRNA